MVDPAQFGLLAALIILNAGLCAFLFTRLENRLDRLDCLADMLKGGFDELRHGLAEDFRAQRAEVAAQISAINESLRHD